MSEIASEERDFVKHVRNSTEPASSGGVRSPECCRPVDVVKIYDTNKITISATCTWCACPNEYQVSWPVGLVISMGSREVCSFSPHHGSVYLVINSPWLWCFSSNNALALQGHDVHGTVPRETTWHCQPTFVGDHAAEGWGPLHKSCVWNHYTSCFFFWIIIEPHRPCWWMCVESSSAKCRHYFRTWHVDVDSLTNPQPWAAFASGCILFHSHRACYDAMMP